MNRYEDHLIIYQRMPSVFNPIAGMKIMKVRAKAGMDHRSSSNNRRQSHG